MIRPIRNPFENMTGYDCFGCCPHNPLGLKMHFFEEGDEIVCTWKPDEHYQGYQGVLHGGIQSTLMDELASWVVFVKLGTSGVTSRMEIVYRKPVVISDGEITLRGSIREKNHRIATIHTFLFGQDGALRTEATVTYFLFPPEKARKDLNYPGIENF